EIEAYVKYNYFDKEQKALANLHRKNASKDKKPFAADKLYYNETADHYICPMGQVMNKIVESKQSTQTGYTRILSKYRAQNCDGCPQRVSCHKAKGNRVIEVSHEGQRLKRQAVERLQSDRGIAYRKRRCYDVEPVFANIKQNKGFRRFML